MVLVNLILAISVVCYGDTTGSSADALRNIFGGSNAGWADPGACLQFIEKKDEALFQRCQDYVNQQNKKREEKEEKADKREKRREMRDAEKDKQECERKYAQDRQKFQKAKGACQSIGVSLSQFNMDKCARAINDCFSSRVSTSSFCSRASKAQMAKDIEDRLDSRKSARDSAWEQKNQIEDDRLRNAEETRNAQLQYQQQVQELTSKIQETQMQAQQAQAQAAQQAAAGQAQAESQIAKFKTDMEKVKAAITRVQTADRAALIAKYTAEIMAREEKCKDDWEKRAGDKQKVKNDLARRGMLKFSSVGTLLSQKQTRDDPYLKRRYAKCLARAETITRLMMVADEQNLKAKIEELKAELRGLDGQIASLKKMAQTAQDAATQVAAQAAQMATMQVQTMGMQIAMAQQQAQNAQITLSNQARSYEERYQRAMFDMREAERKYEEDVRTLDGLEKQGIRASEVDNANKSLDNAKEALEGLDSLENNVEELIGYKSLNCQKEYQATIDLINTDK